MSLAARRTASDRSPAPEAELLRRAQAGDEAAFGELVEQHQRMIHSLGFRLTGSAADAADLAQETFLRAWRQLGGFRGDCAFASWLRRIAVSLALNWRAGSTARQRLHDQWGAENSHDSEGESIGAGAERVVAALQRLEPEYRAALVLTVYEGLNHAEAARTLGCAETTVSWRIWRARRQLRVWLADLAPKKGGFR